MPKPSINTAVSIPHASAITGYPPDVLRIAKANGCAAFIGSRIKIAVLRRFVEAHPNLFAEIANVPSRELVDRQLKQARLEGQRLSNSRMRGETIPREEHERKLAMIARAVWPKISRYVERDAPQLVSIRCQELGIGDEHRLALVNMMVEHAQNFVDAFEDEAEKLGAVRDTQPAPI